MKALIVSLGVVLCLKRLVEIIDCLKALVVLSGVTLCLKRIMELVMIYSASVVMFGVALQLKWFVELILAYSVSVEACGANHVSTLCLTASVVPSGVTLSEACRARSCTLSVTQHSTRKQLPTSVIITFILLLFIILYHVYVYTYTSAFSKVNETKAGIILNRLLTATAFTICLKALVVPLGVTLCLKRLILYLYTAQMHL